MSLALFMVFALASKQPASAQTALQSLTPSEAFALSNSYVQNRLCASLPGTEVGIDDLIRFREELFAFQGGYKGYHLPEAVSGLDKLVQANQMQARSYVSFALELSAIAQKKLQAAEVGQPYMIHNGCSPQVDLGIPLTCHVLTMEQQKTIDQIFRMPAEIAESESKLLQEGSVHGVKRFTLDELRELKRLSRAQGQFEIFMGLSADLGGWKGNADLGQRQQNGEGIKGESFHTVCGHIACIEEATNTHEFIRINYERGNLKYFEPGASFVHRDRVDDPLFPSHYATEVINTRTGERFVVDSWLENGGVPARIISYDQWKKENDLSLVTPIEIVSSKEAERSAASREVPPISGLKASALPPLAVLGKSSRQIKFSLLRAYRGKLVSLVDANRIAERYTDPSEHPSVRDEAFIALENTVEEIKRVTENAIKRTLTDEDYVQFLLNEGHKSYAALAKLVLSWQE